MKDAVSRESTMIVMADGTPACTKCFLRPRRMRRPIRKGAWTGPLRWWPDCHVCHAQYMRDWRAETSTMKVSAEERELIWQLRAAPAGKHHAAS